MWTILKSDCSENLKYIFFLSVSMAHELETDFSHFQVKGDVCRDCLNYKDFKEKCWYFWEDKRDCSQKMMQK